LTVDARIEFYLDVIVTGAAVDGLECFFVGKVFDVRVIMTVRAREICVDGSLEARVVDIERNSLSISFFVEIWIRMTVEACVIVDGVESGRNNDHAEKSEK
jgi:hypothetical protein